MVRKGLKPGRQVQLTLRRCLAVHGAMVVVAMLWFAVQCYWRWHLLPGAPPAALNAEWFFMPVMVVTAAVWQWCCFDTALCHGVSRRSYVKISAVGAALMALAVSVAVISARFGFMASGLVDCYAGDDWCHLSMPFHTPMSENFMYAWSQVTWTAADGDGTVASVPGLAEYSDPVAAGVWPMFLKFLSLMLIGAAIGMLVGALCAWLAGKGPVTFAAVVGVLGVLVVVGTQAYWATGVYRVFGEGTAVRWLLDAASGRVRSHPQPRVDLDAYVVWIPLIVSLALFALCAWLTHLLTARREIRAGGWLARGRTLAALQRS